jgi:hypothetical protein
MTQTKLPWVALVGAAGSGKDTVATEMVERYGYTRVAFADPVRAALLAIDPLITDGNSTARLAGTVDLLGWENTKRLYPEVRYLLQRLGTDAIRAQQPDHWCTLAERKAVAAGGPVVFTDARFMNELQMVEYDHSGTVVHVKRHSEPVLDTAAAAHVSENEWRTWSPTFTVRNYGTKFDLAAAVDTLMKHI